MPAFRWWEFWTLILQRSREAAARLQLSQAYANLDELLRRSPGAFGAHRGAQSVPLSTWRRRSLACGKHVLCEKPLAMNSRESAELVKLAAKSGCAAGVNYNIRYYPLCLEAAEQVRNGQLGRLFHVTGSYVQDWLFHDTDFNWRVLADEGGSLRAVADIGTHWLDLMQAVTGLEVEAVCADLSTFTRCADVRRVSSRHSAARAQRRWLPNRSRWIPRTMVA